MVKLDISEYVRNQTANRGLEVIFVLVCRLYVCQRIVTYPHRYPHPATLQENSYGRKTSSSFMRIVGYQ